MFVVFDSESNDFFVSYLLNRMNYKIIRNRMKMLPVSKVCRRAHYVKRTAAFAAVLKSYCKPGYVFENGHLSRIYVTIYLKRPTRSMAGNHNASSWTCFGWGLQCALRYRTAGSLLHCHFTLTEPYGTAVYFLLHFP